MCFRLRQGGDDHFVLGDGNTTRFWCGLGTRLATNNSLTISLSSTSSYSYTNAGNIHELPLYHISFSLLLLMKTIMNSEND